MRATTAFQVIAFLAVGAAAAPTGLVQARAVDSLAVETDDIASSAGPRADDNGAASAGLKVKRQREYWCPNPVCAKTFATQEERDHHIANTVHPTNSKRDVLLQ